MVKQSPVKFLGETVPLCFPSEPKHTVLVPNHREQERGVKGGFRWFRVASFYGILWGGITETRCLFD